MQFGINKRFIDISSVFNQRFPCCDIKHNNNNNKGKHNP